MQDPRLLGSAGLVSIEGQSVVLSALFCLDQRTLIVRLLQADGTAGRAQLKLHEALGTGWRANLADLEGSPVPGGLLPFEQGGWMIPLQAWGLTTLRMERLEIPCQLQAQAEAPPPW
jgi:hypothetical protein